MEPADARRAHYVARRKRPFFDQADSWRFFIQPNVRAVLVGHAIDITDRVAIEQDLTQA